MSYMENSQQYSANTREGADAYTQKPLFTLEAKSNPSPVSEDMHTKLISQFNTPHRQRDRLLDTTNAILDEQGPENPAVEFPPLTMSYINEHLDPLCDYGYDNASWLLQDCRIIIKSGGGLADVQQYFRYLGIDATPNDYA